MASTPYGTNSYGTNLSYTTSDPRKIAAQQRQLGMAQYAQDTDQQQGVADYLNPIVSPLAEGKGGYNASELSQIQMTPQQQQDIVTGAGISAGNATQATVDAANRAAAAAGGNPSAVAAYRARAARQAGQQAGDAMTQARVAASNAAAGRAQSIGQARIGQQNEGLNYFGNLQQMYNSNAQNAANREQNASSLGVQASQTPSTFDKIMGGVSGALSFLDEGDVSAGTTPAVVGENGPEKVVDLKSRTEHMADGGIPSLASLPNSDDYLNLVANGSGTGSPFQAAPLPAASLGTTTPNADGSMTFTAPEGSAAQQPQGFWKRTGNWLQKNQQQSQMAPTAQQGQPWNPVSSFKTIGSGVGKVLSHLEDGGVASGTQQGRNGIFTEPTRVDLQPGEAVVPLSYRAGAKVRPSLAALPAARSRQNYGGLDGRL